MGVITGRRWFLGDEVPFLPGTHPDRIAPAHLVNGFLSVFFGRGDSAQAIRLFMRGDGAVPPVVSKGIAEDEPKLRGFKESLRTVLDPDHRVFPSGRGSVFPLAVGLVAADPSDDGMGGDLAELVHGCDGQVQQRLASYFNAGEGDALAALGTILAPTSGAVTATLSKKWQKWPWLASGKLGKDFSGSLAGLVTSTFDSGLGVTSWDRVGFVRATYFAAVLGALRSAAILSRAPKSWAELAPMFVFSGTPPGHMQRPETRLAIHSFDAVVAEAVESIRLLMLEKTKGKRLSTSAPASQRVALLIASSFSELKPKQVEDAARSVSRKNTPREIAEALAHQTYPATQVASAFRSLGRMIGFCGPDRGAGAPRFILETPVLGVLVNSTIPPNESMVLEDWLNVIYDRFGLLIGFCSGHDSLQLLARLDKPGPLERAVKSNHEQLRLRLIRAGLAVEYSDGETEVFGPRV